MQIGIHTVTLRYYLIAFNAFSAKAVVNALEPERLIDLGLPFSSAVVDNQKTSPDHASVVVIALSINISWRIKFQGHYNSLTTEYYVQRPP